MYLIDLEGNHLEKLVATKALMLFLCLAQMEKEFYFLPIETMEAVETPTYLLQIGWTSSLKFLYIS